MTTNDLPPMLPLPTLLQTLAWVWRPIDVMRTCAARFGDTFSLELAGLGRVVLTSEPAAIREVFAAPAELARAGLANAVLKPFLGEHSLLVLDGAEHQRQRKLMMPAFHGERMSAYGETMLAVADDGIDRWPLGRPFAVHQSLQDVTLQVILRTVFGVRDEGRLGELSELLKRALEVIAWPGMLFPVMHRDLGPVSPWGRFVRIGARVDVLLRDEVESRRGTGGDDVLAMLLQARDEGGAAMSFEELRDELVTLLVAGHETTATTLAWALHWLMKTPRVGRALAEEVEGAREGGRLAPARVAKLPLLDAVVRETMRMQPVVPIVGRVLGKPMRLGDWDLPAGVMVAPCIYLAQHRAATYEAPDEFRPERFFDRKPSPAEWLPFGGGGRRCIGAAFATYEMKMVLAAVVARTAIAHAPGPAVRAVRRSITLAPSGGLRVVVRERRPRLAPVAAA